MLSRYFLTITGSVAAQKRVPQSLFSFLSVNLLIKGLEGCASGRGVEELIEHCMQDAFLFGKSARRIFCRENRDLPFFREQNRYGLRLIIRSRSFPRENISEVSL